MKTAGRCRSTAATMALLSLLLLGGGGPTIAGAMEVVYRQPTCEEVRLQCAFAPSCSMALHTYFNKCDKMLQDDSTRCPESCLYALVALTSTAAGKQMLDCSCRDGYCEEMKTRVEVCRPLVIEAVQNKTVVSCELAQFICLADPVCTTALGYYHTYCKRMLQGVACTERCLNSVEILQRQETASKLNRCRCSGKATVECLRNKERMVRLCYGGGGGFLDDAADTRSQQQGGHKSGGRKNRKKHRPRMFDQDPDRAEVEMMLVDPEHQPGGRNRYNATAAADGDDHQSTDTAASALVVRPPPLADVVLLAAIALLVTRSLWPLCA